MASIFSHLTIVLYELNKKTFKTIWKDKVLISLTWALSVNVLFLNLMYCLCLWPLIYDHNYCTELLSRYQFQDSIYLIQWPWIKIIHADNRISQLITTRSRITRANCINVPTSKKTFPTFWNRFFLYSV